MSNLVYAFIDSNFNNNTSVKKTYSYNALPEYYLKTIERNSSYFDRSYFLLQDSIIKEIKSKVSSNVELVSIEDQILNTEEYGVVDGLLRTIWPRYSEEVFLYHAFLRLIFVGIFTSKFNLKNVIHLEADNLVYDKGTKVFDNNIIESGEFAYSLVSPLVAAPGIMCFKDSTSGRNFLTRIVKMLMAGEEEVLSAIGFSLDYITDMNFLDVISRGSKFFKLLPSLPFTDLSTHLKEFNLLFDPASYGQFLGGTNNGHEKGYYENIHYIGRMIGSKKIEVKFEKTPYVLYENEKYPLYNLHIHNKKAIDSFL